MSCKRDTDCQYYRYSNDSWPGERHQCTLHPPHGEKPSFWGLCPATCERNKYARQQYRQQKLQMEFNFEEIVLNEDGEKRK